MKKILQIFLLVLGLSPCLLYAQTIVRGTVKDNLGPVPGVTVLEKDSKGNGTTTNERGLFQITLRGNSKILIFTSIGYVTQELNLAGRTNVTITLKDDAKGLEDVVVVGYGTKTKLTNTGAASSVSAADIRNTPTANIQNTLAGRAPGFVSQQRSGQPGRTGAEFFIRGVNSLSSESQKPLIMVDDVEYTYDQVAQLDANEIESFTVLKDASTTAVFGIKGANGVLVITTRRGKIGKARVNFNTESGLQQAVNNPKFLNAYSVALLRNEALRNDGLATEFTDEDLEHWRVGDDPYGHPDVDWYNAVFKNSAYQMRNNVDVSGGNERVKYFLSAGQLTQNGLLRDFSKGTDAPQNNYKYQRYNFRSNLDMQATKDLTLRLDVSGRIGTITEPHITTAPLSTIYSFQRLPPYAEPLLNPDGSYPWAFRSRPSFYETSLIGRLALQGYDKTYRNEFNILVNASHKLDFLTKGLSVTGRIAYAGDVSYDRSLYRSNIPASYYNPVNNTYTIHSNGLYRLEPLTLASTANNSISNKTINTLARLDYNRSFGDHRISGLVLYNLNSATAASYNSATGITAVQEYAPVSSQGLTFRADYNYKQRYLIDFSGAYNGTSEFVGDKSMGFFPAVSVGWNISEEPFIKKHIKFLDLLKIRGSVGLVGSDITRDRTYKTEQIYVTGTGYNFGETSNTAIGIEEGTLGNLNITWEKARQTDIGFDAQFLRSKLSITADYFFERRYDQLYQRENVLQVIGVKLPYTNSAVTEKRGYDGQIRYSDKAGKFDYSTSFTFSFSKNKIIDQGEAPPRYAYLAKTGLPIGQGFGYNALGFFQTQDEINNYAHLADTQPGDLKYEDMNNDGVIDQQDYRAIGKPNLPQTVLGATFGLGYGGFSVNVLFQGSFDYSYRIATAGVIPFQGNLQESALGRWTPATATTATYPRLSSNLAGPSSPSNLSSFWLVNAKYVRLKSVDLGYTIPKRWLTKLRVSTARLYLSGYDLITWANFDLYSQDPEVASNGSAGTYPVQKVFNLGLQIGF
ncbi:TonB-dependent receptor [Mucilaginibacter sp. PAMB04168]|uniref:SusC/RagA family TonB-linked outer membrane protein n=1 Tax=Mucilaginibacter sp. PAMB04168 TaxID=3138567 RepID=UPI0031F6B0C4